MPKNVKDAKLCLLTCAFEPPKPKTKHKLDINSKEAYEKLFEREQKYFSDMVQQCKDVGTNLVRTCSCFCLLPLFHRRAVLDCLWWRPLFLFSFFQITYSYSSITGDHSK